MPPRTPSKSEAEDESPPKGEEVMRRVRAQLPRRPMRMAGLVRTRRDGRDRDRRLISELRFGDEPPRAVYRLFDALGEPLTRVEVTWPQGEPVYAQWDGNDQRLPAPDADDEVVDTGITWSDLSLGFLWWPQAELEGTARVKTRSSHVVTIPAPPGREDIASVKLWVDRKAYFILKAELFDADETLVKRIEVDTIAEIRKDVWMVKNLLIRDWRRDLRTGIRFEEVEELEEPEETDAEDAAGEGEATEDE